jgi:hypothetical protein
MTNLRIIWFSSYSRTPRSRLQRGASDAGGSSRSRAARLAARLACIEAGMPEPATDHGHIVTGAHQRFGGRVRSN